MRTPEERLDVMPQNCACKCAGRGVFFSRQVGESVVDYGGMIYRRSLKGFTLIELMVVIGILALLAGIGASTVFGFMSAGDVAKCRANIDQLARLGVKYGEDMMHQNLLPTSGMDDDDETPEVNESEGWWVTLAQEMDSTVLPGRSKGMKVANIFHCPGDRRRKVENGPLIEANVNTISYVSWTDGSEDRSNPHSQIRTLGKKHLDTLPWLSDGNPVKGKSVIDYDSFLKMVMPAVDRHSNTILVAYASGMVQAFEVNDEKPDPKKLFLRINPEKTIPIRNNRK